MDLVRRYAKEVLKQGGVDVFQKDIKKVVTHSLLTLEHPNGDGTSDKFSHRDLVLIEMKNGTIYEVLRETVDKEGNFSTGSAKMVTREIRTKED